MNSSKNLIHHSNLKTTTHWEHLKTIALNPAILIGALGYFVDIYDLVLFSIVRVPSLQSLGFDAEALLKNGILLINLQMAGMLLGGILWGILGDRKGRLTVLLGSILLYSTANILNAFVTTLPQYAILRFLAGIGLAGELGAAITLVSESLPTTLRGYGTTLVASIGVCGALLAGWIGEHFDWKMAYLVGGLLGLGLLLTRIRVAESDLFKKLLEKTKSESKKQSFLKEIKILFRSRYHTLKYLKAIGIGLPIWFVIGILITFSPELAKQLGCHETVTGGRAIMFAYAGLAIGDLLSGLISQQLNSRKQSTLIFLGVIVLFSTLYFLLSYLPHGFSALHFYWICFGLGLGSGYWAMFVTIASEQFGTNIRATVTTTVPNFVRGSVVMNTFLFQFFKPYLGLIHSALLVGCANILLALVSVYTSEETYAKDLNYIESHHSSTT